MTASESQDTDVKQLIPIMAQASDGPIQEWIRDVLRYRGCIDTKWIITAAQKSFKPFFPQKLLTRQGAYLNPYQRSTMEVFAENRY